MTRYDPPFPFLVGILFICILYVIPVRLQIATFGSKKITFTGPLLPYQQNTFTENKKSLGGLDQQLIDDILPSVVLNTNRDNVLRQSLKCKKCHAAASKIRKFLMLNATQATIIKEGILVCTGFKIQTPRVCAELLPTFAPWAITVVANTVFSSDNFCKKFCPKFDHPENPDKIELPPPRNSRQTANSTQNDEKIWVVHLSDWHHDPEYFEGYDVDCGEPVCCRPPNAFGDKAKSPAGRWGGYNCDVPRRLIENMLEFMPTVVPKIDYILSTGDLPPHDIWAETQLSIKGTTSDVSNIWRKFFSQAQFFPIIGNHESAPVNSFPTSSLSNFSSVSWLYNTLSSQWSLWLPEDAHNSIKKRGFYSTRLPKDNMRIIGLNTNFWYKLNWWMLMRPKGEWDPEHMLEWMVEELDDAERLGEKVWIIGHMIPVSQDAFPSFNRYFSQIVARYNDTIVGQFYGHAHWDEFHIFYDHFTDVENREPQPVGVGYLAPSVTTYRYMNPAFRVYEINKKTKHILNHFTYYLDLEEANRNNKPEWKLLYDAKSLYKLQDLEPQSWHDLTERFLTDDDAFQTFKKIASRDQALNRYGSCGALESPQDCKNRIICYLRSTLSSYGPFSSHELCKKQMWKSSLPEDWFLTGILGKKVNVQINMDKFEEDGDGIVIHESQNRDKSNEGITIKGLPRAFVRLVMGLVIGGDDAICR